MHYSDTKQQMNYEQIKQLARDERDGKITDLIVLAPQNDPFYTGTLGIGRSANGSRLCGIPSAMKKRMFVVCIIRLSVKTHL